MAQTGTAEIQGSLLSREDLVRRVVFTLAALAVIRALAFVPLPGLEPTLFLESMRTGAGRTSILSDFRPAESWSLLALGITPYITALILVTFASAGSNSGRVLLSGRGAKLKAYNQRARILALVIAAMQAYFLARAMNAFPTVGGRPLLWLTGPVLVLSTVATLVAATMLVMYIAEQINTRGVGQGTWVVLSASIIWQIDASSVLGALPKVTAADLVPPLALLLTLVAVIVLVELAYRRVRPSEIVSPARPNPDALPTLHIRLNTAGYLAPYFAYLLLAFPISLAQMLAASGTGTGGFLFDALMPGNALHALLYGVVIAIVAFVLAALYHDTQAMAQPYRGGGPLTDHTGFSEARRIDRVLFRVTVFSALYLVVISVVPMMVSRRFGWTVVTDGLLVLIVVTVALNVLEELGVLPQADAMRAPVEDAAAR